MAGPAAQIRGEAHALLRRKFQDSPHVEHVAQMLAVKNGENKTDWENWIEEAENHVEDYINALESAHLFKSFEDAREKANIYWESENSGMHVDIRRDVAIGFLKRAQEFILSADNYLREALAENDKENAQAIINTAKEVKTTLDNLLGGKQK